MRVSAIKIHQNPWTTPVPKKLSATKKSNNRIGTVEDVTRAINSAHQTGGARIHRQGKINSPPTNIYTTAVGVFPYPEATLTGRVIFKRVPPIPKR